MSLFFTISPAVFLLLLLASCSKEGNPSPDLPSGRDVPIGFSSSVSSLPEVRGTGAVVTDIDKMYVFASYTGTSDWQTGCLPNFMYKQLMSKESSSGSWTYSPVKYWPNNNNDQISFFAFAPANITGIVPSAVNTAGPQLTYNMPTAESNKQDLLVSSCLNRMKEGGAITFTMKHVLTQVKVKVKNTNVDIGEAVLKELEVLMPGSGTLVFENDKDNSIYWVSYGTQTAIIADVNLGSGKTITLNSTAREVANFFLFSVGDPSLVVTLRLTYTVKKTSSTEEPVTLIVPVSLPATPVWEQGTGIVYTVSIADGRLEVEDVTVITDFTEESTGITGNITAT